MLMHVHVTNIYNSSMHDFAWTTESAPGLPNHQRILNEFSASYVPSHRQKPLSKLSRRQFCRFSKLKRTLKKSKFPIGGEDRESIMLDQSWRYNKDFS
jgi:hypothetical protein